MNHRWKTYMQLPAWTPIWIFVIDFLATWVVLGNIFAATGLWANGGLKAGPRISDLSIILPPAPYALLLFFAIELAFWTRSEFALAVAHLANIVPLAAWGTLHSALSQDWKHSFLDIGACWLLLMAINGAAIAYSRRCSLRRVGDLNYTHLINPPGKT